MELEIWKPIQEYEDTYLVSNMGNIKSLDREVDLRQLGKVNKKTIKGVSLKQYFFTSGYKYVCLCKNDIRIKKSMHRLVALSFIPNPENKPQVNHINGIKTDNRVENLEWVNASENKIHAISTGLVSSIGENHPDAALTNEQVREIRKLFITKFYTLKQISELYNVNPLIISRLTRYKTYKHVV